MNGFVGLDGPALSLLVSLLRRECARRERDGEDMPADLVDLLDALQTAPNRTQPHPAVDAGRAGIVDDVEALALTIPEAAQAARVSQRKMEDLVSAGDVPTKQIGRRRVVPVQALTDYLNGGRTNGDASTTDPPERP